jgi:hypothetical protein
VAGTSQGLRQMHKVGRETLLLRRCNNAE